MEDEGKQEVPSTEQSSATTNAPETGSATSPANERIPSVKLNVPGDNNDVHEYVLEDAGEGEKITSTRRALVGQFAVVRSSTAKKTKRKTLRRTKRAEKRGSEISNATPTGYLKEDADVLTILDHMRKDVRDAPLQLRCLLAIERLVETEAANRDVVAQNGGIELILEAANNCKSNKDVQGSACWVLSNLCRNKDLNSRLVEKGCIDIVMQVFTEHSAIERVQHACLAVICNLALNVDTLKKLVAADVVPNVTRTIRDFPENEWIQFTAVQVLQNTANVADLCAKLMEANIMSAVLQSMDTCNDHDELLQSSLWIFSSLAFNGQDETRVALMECGVLPSIIRAMKDCEGHHGVFFTGCSAIANLARTGDIVDTIVKSEAVPLLLNILQQCLNDASVLRTGCRALVLLLESNDAHKQCKQHGASKLLKKILDENTEEPVAMEAKQALKLLKTKGGGCIVM